MKEYDFDALGIHIDPDSDLEIAMREYDQKKANESFATNLPTPTNKAEWIHVDFWAWCFAYGLDETKFNSFEQYLTISDRTNKEYTANLSTMRIFKQRYFGFEFFYNHSAKNWIEFKIQEQCTANCNFCGVKNSVQINLTFAEQKTKLILCENCLTAFKRQLPYLTLNKKEFMAEQLTKNFKREKEV